MSNSELLDQTKQAFLVPIINGSIKRYASIHAEYPLMDSRLLMSIIDQLETIIKKEYYNRDRNKLFG